MSVLWQKRLGDSASDLLKHDDADVLAARRGCWRSRILDPR